MALSIEWRRRIERWHLTLKQYMYQELGTIDLCGYKTCELLNVDDVRDEEYVPMPEGTPWGKEWEFCFFKGKVDLPEEAKGKRIVARMNVGKMALNIGGESAIYVNGKICGSCDREHPEFTLTYDGVPGEHYDIMVEASAGCGKWICDVDPVKYGADPVPAPKEPLKVVGRSTYGIWEEEIFQLWIDVNTLLTLRDGLDETMLRVSEIDKGLMDFTLIVDLERPYDEIMESVKTARARLKPLLECVNGSTMPRLYAFGYSHLDVAWMWPLAETQRKATRTLSNQIALMEEYPEYIFLNTQPHVYNMLKENYPELYSRVKEKVESGNIIPEGSAWVQPDLNVPSGESLIRQMFYGKKFFREEFGVDNELLWVPDSFGFSGNIPQLMKGCGVNYFATCKLTWLYNGGEEFPYNTFMWEGIDGTEVLADLFNGVSNTNPTPKELIKRWNGESRQLNTTSTRLLPFGHGDGGGGATREHLEYLRRSKDLEGAPRTNMSTPTQFFKDFEKAGLPKEKYVGELYLGIHRGVLTSQAKVKKGNRKSEFALREAEMWASAATVNGNYTYKKEEMDKMWRLLLLNQFHDILPGSSIERVHQEAIRDFDIIVNAANDVCDEAVNTIAGNNEGMTVFNSLSWDRNSVVEIDDALISKDGESVPAQVIDGKTYALLSAPSCGYKSYNKINPVIDEASELKVSILSIENKYLSIKLNESGEIVSMVDKETGFEYAAGPLNSLKMYKDVPTLYDAWDIESVYEESPFELDNKAEIKVLYAGPIEACIRVERKLNESYFTQDIIVRNDSRRIDFKTIVDWKETHKLLKANFPVDIHTNEVVSEIQFGYIKRPNHFSRQFDQDRFEVCNQKWSALCEGRRGVAVLNDCKYGINAKYNSLNLTLLRAPAAPDPRTDKTVHEFTYSVYPFNGDLMDSNVVREGYELNAPVVVTKGSVGEKSLFSVDASNIVIDTVKPDDENSKDIIVRLYESMNAKTDVTLTTTLNAKEVIKTNMIEEDKEKLEVSGNKIKLTFKPFEVKTIRIKL